MSLEERILNIAEAPASFYYRELRAIALEVRKREDRIKQLEDRIKRLEEAGQRVDDAAHSIQDWSGTVLGDALDELNNAKEDKP